jgi:dipeptidyl aminopeptidase/acylaminoacyl peptidase
MRSAARVSLLATLVAGFSAWTCVAQVPVIPREQIFGPVARAKARISPDGHRLAYLAPTEVGAFNIWITDTAAPAAGKPLTRVNGKGVDGYRWAEDNTHILYWTDNAGDEVWHLYSVDIGTGRSQDLTPFPNVKIQNLLTDEHHPHEVLVGLNKRIPTAFDMYRINIDDGSMRLEASNPGDVISWTANPEFNIRAATAFVPASGATVLRVRDRPDGTWRDLLTWSFEESLFEGQINGGSIVAGFTRDGKSLYAISATGADKSRLVKVETATGHWRPIAGGACDVSSDSGYPGVDYDLRPLILQNPGTGDVDAVAFECAERSWQVINPAVSRDLSFLRSHLPGFPYVASRSRDDTLWVVATWAGDRPLEYSLFDRRKNALQPLFSEHPFLSGMRLAKPRALTLTARDGSKIPVYLTRPIPDDTAAAPGKSSRVPLVLYPHGGPWDRDHDMYDPFVQFLANRGYAVLQVEYRGSVGFGKTYLNAGNHEFGLKMRDDLIDAVEWTVQTGIADPARIAVYGESGGGYLALRVTEARPDLFRATIDVVGPTDVKFLLESMPNNWQAIKSRWVRRIGDAEHDESLNRKLSPQFDGPLSGSSFLIAMGAHDPRVNPQHADRIVERLLHAGIAVEQLVYLDEGHGFARPENNMDFFGRVEVFLARNLGGRAEAFSPQAGARVEIK